MQPSLIYLLFWMLCSKYIGKIILKYSKADDKLTFKLFEGNYEIFLNAVRLYIFYKAWVFF